MVGSFQLQNTLSVRAKTALQSNLSVWDTISAFRAYSGTMTGNPNPQVGGLQTRPFGLVQTVQKSFDKDKVAVQ